MGRALSGAGVTRPHRWERLWCMYTHLSLSDAVSGQLDDGEVALADGAFDVVESYPDGGAL